MSCHDEDCRAARIWAANRIAELERELEPTGYVAKTDALRRELDEARFRRLVRRNAVVRAAVEAAAAKRGLTLDLSEEPPPPAAAP